MLYTFPHEKYLNIFLTIKFNKVELNAHTT